MRRSEELGSRSFTGRNSRKYVDRRGGLRRRVELRKSAFQSSCRPNIDTILPLHSILSSIDVAHHASLKRHAGTTCKGITPFIVIDFSPFCYSLFGHSSPAHFSPYSSASLPDPSQQSRDSSKGDQWQANGIGREDLVLSRSQP